MNRLVIVLLLSVLSLPLSAQKRFDGNFGVGVVVPISVGDGCDLDKFVDVAVMGYYKLFLSSRIYAMGELGVFYDHSDGISITGLPGVTRLCPDNVGVRPGMTVGVRLNSLMDVFTGIYGRFVFCSDRDYTENYSRAVWPIGISVNVWRMSVSCSYDVMIGTKYGNAVAVGLRYNF